VSEAPQYRVVVWCRDCTWEDPPYGCHFGEPWAIGTYSSLAEAIEAGDHEIWDAPWEFRVEKDGEVVYRSEDEPLV
jgi:hypothetical protein